MTPLPPLTSATALSSWSFGPIGSTIIALLLVGYLAGVRAVARTGAHWSGWRTTCWVIGLGALLLTTDSAVGLYSHELFWMHMIQHLLLINVVPALLVLGHPLRLLQTTGRRGAGFVEALRRNAVVAFVTNPVVALALYAVVLVGTHLTTFMQQMPTHMWLHPAEEVLYLVSGYLFLQPILAREPIRWDPPYPARIGLLFVSMIVDAGVGVALMTTDADPFPAFSAMRMGWGPSPLDDVHEGGGLMWVAGDGLMMLAILVMTLWWLADTERQNDIGAFLDSARRRALGFDDEADDEQPDGSPSDRVVGRAPPRMVDVDGDDRALAAYNRMLARLAEHDQQS